MIKDTFIELTIDGKIYDVSELLIYGSFSINELFCNSEYTSSLNSCSFELKFNEDIFFALRDAQETIKVKIFSEENPCRFEGTMDPVFSNDWTVPSEPENIKLEAVDFTEALDNKIEESITLPAEIGDSGFWIYKRGDESSSIIPILLEKAGMANRISTSAPDIPIQILHLAIKKNDATYREVIDALLKDYQYVFTIIDGSYITWGKTSYQTINENEIETIDEEKILGNNSKKFSISKKYEVYNGIKLTWPKTKIMEDALLWRGNLPVGSSEIILPGDSIASQDYWPSDSDIVETWMNFETDYLDTDYLSRKTRLKNEDLDLISSSNQYIKDIKDEGVVLDDIEGESVIFEGLRARFRYKNTSSEIKKLYWSEVYGKALIKDSNVETVFPENSSNPKSVPTNYIYDKDSAQTAVEAQWAQLKNGCWIIKFSSLKELKPGQVIKIKQLVNRWNGFAFVRSRSKVDNFSGVFEYECRSISATETLSVSSVAQVNSTKTNGIKGDKGDPGETGESAPLVPYQLIIYSNIATTPTSTTLDNPIPTGWSQSIQERTIDDIIYLSTATVNVNESATEYIDSIVWATPTVYLTTEIPLQLQVDYDGAVLHVLGSDSVDQSSNARIRYKRINYTVLSADITATVDKDSYVALIDNGTNANIGYVKLVYPYVDSITGNLTWRDLTDGTTINDITCLIGRVTPEFDETYNYGKDPQEILEANFMKILSNAKDLTGVDLNKWATAMGVDNMIGTLAVLKLFVDQVIVNHVNLGETGYIDAQFSDYKFKLSPTEFNIENANVTNVTANNIQSPALKTINTETFSSSTIVANNPNYWKTSVLASLCANVNTFYELVNKTFDGKDYKYIINSTGSSLQIANISLPSDGQSQSYSYSIKGGGNVTLFANPPRTSEKTTSDETATCTVTSSYGTARASNPSHPSSAVSHNGNVRYSDGNNTYTKTLSPGQTVTFDGYVVSTSAPYYTWTETSYEKHYATVTISANGNTKILTTYNNSSWTWDLPTDCTISVTVTWPHSYAYYKVAGSFSANIAYSSGVNFWATDNTKQFFNSTDYSSKVFDLKVGTTQVTSSANSIYNKISEYISTIGADKTFPCQSTTSWYEIGTEGKKYFDTVSLTSSYVSFYLNGSLVRTFSSTEYIANFTSQIVEITGVKHIKTENILPIGTGRTIGQDDNRFSDIFGTRVWGAVAN